MVSTLDFESSDLSSNLGGTVELLLRHEKKNHKFVFASLKVVYSLWLCDQHMLFSRFHGVLVSSLYSESRNPAFKSRWELANLWVLRSALLAK